MTGRALYFTGAESVAVREKPVDDPGPGQVRVRTERSGISPGTELLVYRGDVSSELPTDETIEALDGTFSYPLQYGYAAVGRVTAVGAGVDDAWLDRRVFAFNPHESHFLADPETLVPTTLSPEQAVLIPNAEAAANFVMDGRPRFGARVAVFGQGPVGLLTTALFAEFPLSRLVAVDPCASRRELSRSLGADRALAPADLDDLDEVDMAVELSGDPAALDDAIDVTGYAGRVLVGSWYGTKDVSLDLGDAYHRSHIRVRASQVSRIDPDHADRWDKDRRLDAVCAWLAETDLSALHTREFDVSRAPEAYRLLDERPNEAIQVTLTYD